MNNNLNTFASPTRTLMRTALVDITLLVVACLVPTLSHITALPLYHLNPMLLVLLAGMLLVRNRANAFLLAVMLPLVSMMIVGMPTPLKAICMTAEMLTLVGLFTLMDNATASARGRMGRTFAILLAAMVASKIVYYAMKALLISPDALISTPLLTQVVVMVVAALLFGIAGSRLTRN